MIKMWLLSDLLIAFLDQPSLNILFSSMILGLRSSQLSPRNTTSPGRKAQCRHQLRRVRANHPRTRRVRRDKMITRNGNLTDVVRFALTNLNDQLVVVRTLSR